VADVPSGPIWTPPPHYANLKKKIKERTDEEKEKAVMYFLRVNENAEYRIKNIMKILQENKSNIYQKSD
jgi:hypothetical protein